MYRTAITLIALAMTAAPVALADHHTEPLTLIHAGHLIAAPIVFPSGSKKTILAGPVPPSSVSLSN